MLSHYIFDCLWGVAKSVSDRFDALMEIWEGDGVVYALTLEEILDFLTLCYSIQSSNTLSEFAEAIDLPEEILIEEYEIPEDLACMWNKGQLPEWHKKVLAFAVLSDRFAEGRSHTCQSCGSTFYSTDKAALLCPSCDDEE